MHPLFAYNSSKRRIDLGQNGVQSEIGRSGGHTPHLPLPMRRTDLTTRPPVRERPKGPGGRRTTVSGRTPAAERPGCSPFWPLLMISEERWRTWWCPSCTTATRSNSPVWSINMHRLLYLFLLFLCCCYMLLERPISSLAVFYFDQKYSICAVYRGKLGVPLGWGHQQALSLPFRLISNLDCVSVTRWIYLIFIVHREISPIVLTSVPIAFSWCYYFLRYDTNYVPGFSILSSSVCSDNCSNFDCNHRINSIISWNQSCCV